MPAAGTPFARRGKYEIAFAFRVRRGPATSLFAVSPSKGVVEPGQAVDVCVTFCSREEVHLKVTHRPGSPRLFPSVAQSASRARDGDRGRGRRGAHLGEAGDPDGTFLSASWW